VATIFGPDINTKHGDGGDVLKAALADGERFVGIKAGGGNVGLYVAPRYEEQMRAARRHRLPVVHFWVSGNQSIGVQARFAIANTVDWRDGDAIAWDNEALDSTGQIRNDVDSTLWINTVRGSLGLNCPPKAVWHYGSSGSTFRDHGPWPNVKATGCTIWVAAYPGPPDMSGTGLSCDVHQFTDAHIYPGSDVPTDRNKTRRALADLFPTRGPRAASAVPKTTTSSTGSPGAPGSNCWKRMQLLGRSGGYAGLIDGVLGVFSWEGIQRALHDAGLYDGVIDGAPATLTFRALQQWAGVARPSDVETWRGLSRDRWRAIGTKLNTL
jgi:hypothetical protein